MKTLGMALLVLALIGSSRVAETEEVSLSYTASTLTFLAGRIAADHGFFRQEGLDVKFVQMRSAALVPALGRTPRPSRSRTAEPGSPGLMP